jgi:hypothetical protein
VLGAGLDTRAYRLADPQRVGAYEVDLPANIDTKRSRVRAALGELPTTSGWYRLTSRLETLRSRCPPADSAGTDR